MRLVRHAVLAEERWHSRRNLRRQPRSPKDHPYLRANVFKNVLMGERTSLQSTQCWASRSKSTQRGVDRSKSMQRVVGFLGGSHEYPSTVDDCAQTDTASSVSFGETLVQKNHTPLE